MLGVRGLLRHRKRNTLILQAAIVRDTPQAFRLAPPDDAGAREKYDLARQIRIGARDLEETGGTSCADKVFGAFKDDTSVFSTMFVHSLGRRTGDKEC